jgi:hypothetical protein
LEPSDRVIMPRSLAFAPPEAVTVPCAATGGQVLAHVPEHADWPLVSFVHMYTACPDPSVKTMPPLPEAVVITIAPAAEEPPPAAGDPLAGDPLLLALLHAAASNAAPIVMPSPAPTRTGTGIRAIIDLPISSSPPWRARWPASIALS